MKEKAKTAGTPYDWGSIMHYGLYAFAIKPKVRTLIPKVEVDPDIEIGQRKELSEHDIAVVTAKYSGTWYDVLMGVAWMQPPRLSSGSG